MRPNSGENLDEKEPTASRSYFSDLAIPSPNPLLPKSVKVYDRPPDCPLASIKFRLLAPFKEFENVSR